MSSFNTRLIPVTLIVLKLSGDIGNNIIRAMTE